ncbi:RasGAP SH3 binding protein rasputin [Trachipleistophora hominis]|uniref:RasGAP SH3 binding protein rasputin n=1 Tax=Trachipleistophora hominis TaxID=72359 RepID=L7JQV9_TRAHO|nr:RasGAP SH3 binding protein rasputin [Trachipleistophora hominis]
MTDSQFNTPKKFLNEYYGSLCSSYQSIIPFYDSASQISISHEDNVAMLSNTSVMERLLSLHHKKKVIKVLVSCYEHHMLSPHDFLVCVLGQFVYHDNSTVRFSHTFIVDCSNMFVIKNEILKVLDEEVIYKAIDFKEKVSNVSNTIRIVRGLDKNRNKLVVDFAKYGNLVAVEVDKNDVLVEYEDEEMVKSLVNDVSFIKSKGYKVEFN